MTTSSAQPPRSPTWQQRRCRIQREIVATAIKLFGAEGYENVTIDSIASASLISSRTFYRYFPAKEDLVFHGFPDLIDLLRRKARSSHGSLLNRLRDTSVALAEALESDRDTWICRFNLILGVPSLRVRDAALNERYEDVFRETILEQWPDSAEAKRNSRLLAGAIMGGMQTAIKIWVTGGGKPALPFLANAVFDTLESAGFTSAEISPPPDSETALPLLATRKNRSHDSDWASWMNRNR